MTSWENLYKTYEKYEGSKNSRDVAAFVSIVISDMTKKICVMRACKFIAVQRKHELV